MRLAAILVFAARANAALPTKPQLVTAAEDSFAPEWLPAPAKGQFRPGWTVNGEAYTYTPTPEPTLGMDFWPTEFPTKYNFNNIDGTAVPTVLPTPFPTFLDTPVPTLIPTEKPTPVPSDVPTLPPTPDEMPPEMYRGCVRRTTNGHKCSLPFVYKGKTYWDCTMKDAVYNFEAWTLGQAHRRSWCATKSLKIEGSVKRECGKNGCKVIGEAFGWGWCQENFDDAEKSTAVWDCSNAAIKTEPPAAGAAAGAASGSGSGSAADPVAAAVATTAAAGAAAATTAAAGAAAATTVEAGAVAATTAAAA